MTKNSFSFLILLFLLAISDFDSEKEEALQLPIPNGKQEAKKEEKPAVPAKKDVAPKQSATGKHKVKIVEPEKDTKSEGNDSDDDDRDDSYAMSEDSDDDEDNEDSSDDDEEDSDEEEETPKKQQSGKKRPNESAIKTPEIRIVKGAICEIPSRTWLGKCTTRKCSKRCIEWERANYGACDERDANKCFCYYECHPKDKKPIPSPPKEGQPAPPGGGYPAPSPPQGKPSPPSQGGQPAPSPPQGGKPTPSPPGSGQPGSPPPKGGQPTPPGGGHPAPTPPEGGKPTPPGGGQPAPSPPEGGKPTPPKDGQPAPPGGGQPAPPGGGSPPPKGGQPNPPECRIPPRDKVAAKEIAYDINNNFNESIRIAKICEQPSKTWFGTCKDTIKCDKQCIDWEDARHGACHQRESSYMCFCYYSCDPSDKRPPVPPDCPTLPPKYVMKLD